MEYNSFQRINIIQQFKRAYLFISILTILAAAFVFFCPEATRNLVLIFFLNGVVILSITAFLHLLVVQYKKNISDIANIAGNIFMVDLLIAERITCSYSHILLSPIFVIAFLVLTLKLMNDRTNPNRKEAIKKSVFSICVFILSIFILEIIHLPFFPRLEPNYWMMSSKIILAITPFFLVSYVYDLVLESYRSQIKQTQDVNEKLIDAMRFVICGEIFTVILHDLKNMVSAIYWSVENVKKEYQNILTKGDFSDLETKLEEIRRIALLFIDYVRMDWAAVEKISVQKVLDNAITFVCQSKKVSREINFKTASSTELSSCCIRASEYRLYSVFLNILTNSIQSLQAADMKDKEIRTGVSVEDRNVIIRISDNGPGIIQENLKKIFQVFTTRPVGAGLGLYLASKYVTSELQGKITVDSTPYKATTFTITLPLSGVDEPTHERAEK